MFFELKTISSVRLKVVEQGGDKKMQLSFKKEAFLGYNITTKSATN